MGEGRIYLGQLDGRMVALDQRTGEVVWSIQAERWQEGLVITSAPLYYDGLVITGFAGAEFAHRGRVKAFRADNGEHVWTLYTVPGPGEFGHETWPAQLLWSTSFPTGRCAFASSAPRKAKSTKLACPLPARASRGRSTGKMRSIGFIRQIT